MNEVMIAENILKNWTTAAILSNSDTMRNAANFWTQVDNIGDTSEVTSTTAISLSPAYCGKKILMTAAGEVGMPDCAANYIGCTIEIEERDGAEAIELVMYGDTTNDYFVLQDGTALDANDEADLAAAARNRVKVVCKETNKWYVEEIRGAVSDGGVAD